MTFHKSNLPVSKPIKVISNPVSKHTQFKFVNRGFSETLLLISGWGLDHRIFTALDLKYNYLVATSVWPSDFVSKLETALQKLNLGRISILGHSMGGFLAVDFVVKYPDKVAKLILVGVRKRYDVKEIDLVRENIKKRKAGFMYKMYDQSFSAAEKDILSHFKSTLLKIYIKEMDKALLEAGLEYLSKAEIRTEDLKHTKIRFIHGEADAIAPISEVETIVFGLPEARFDRVKGGGHMLPLREDFNSIFYGDKIE